MGIFGRDWDEDYRKPWPDIPPPGGDYGWNFRVSMKPIAVDCQKSTESLRDTMTRIKAQLFMKAHGRNNADQQGNYLYFTGQDGG